MRITPDSYNATTNLGGHYTTNIETVWNNHLNGLKSKVESPHQNQLVLQKFSDTSDFYDFYPSFDVHEYLKYDDLKSMRDWQPFEHFLR